MAGFRAHALAIGGGGGGGGGGPSVARGDQISRKLTVRGDHLARGTKYFVTGHLEQSSIRVPMHLN